MARNEFYLVTIFVVLLAAVAVSCAAPETNRPIYVESSFTDEEAAAVVEAIETWNAAGRAYVGEDLIDYRGRWTDRNGLDSEGDLGDNRNVIYDGSPVFDEFTAGETGVSGGQCYGEDVVVFLNVIRDKEDEDSYLAGVRHVAMHELGHWLGLPDEYGPEGVDSIMYWKRSPDGFKLELSQSDLENLCVVYDCVRNP